jgi:transcriptional regulator with XRE-family HTH domain
MADNSWQDLELWDRVKWARRQHFPSATAAAKAVGMEAGTYRCYERGPGSAKFIPLDYKHAQLFAREFTVSWEWLLDGLGRPWLTEDDAEPAADADGDAEDKPRNYLRAWREYRGLKVAELAKRSGLGAQTINELESGATDIASKQLDVLAPALSTQRGFILDFDPKDADPSIFDTVQSIPKERRSQALEILKTFRPYNRLR